MTRDEEQSSSEQSGACRAEREMQRSAHRPPSLAGVAKVEYTLVGGTHVDPSFAEVNGSRAVVARAAPGRGVRTRLGHIR
jgi:hypothetical protein